MTTQGSWTRQDEEPRLRALLEHATDLTVVCDIRGVPVFATPSLGTILGLTLADIGGEAFHPEFIHPEDIDGLMAMFDESRLEKGAPAPVEFRAQHNDGSWRILQGAITHMLDDPAVRGIIVNVRDVTEAREAEAALRRSEQRWKVLFENSSDLVNVFGSDGRMIFTSGPGTLLGHDPDVTDDPATLFALMHPDDLDMAAATFERMLTTPGVTGPAVVRVQHADGGWRWIESIANNLLHDDEVQGIVVHTRDITARKAAEDALRDQSRLVETLHGIGQTLAAELDLEKLVHAVTDAAVEVSGARFGMFRGTREPLMVAASGEFPPAFRFPPELVSRVLDGAGSVRTNDILAVSVRSREGEVLGALLCGGPVDGVFHDWGERMLVGIAAHAAVALDNARLYQEAQDEIRARKHAEAELAHAATHDPLTGLPNRSLFLDRLAMALGRASRGQGAVGVLLFDLDRFKVVNDSLGHVTGDQLLVQVAERLAVVVRPGDTVARLGGDEFVMVCDELNGEIDAIGIADRMAEALAAPFSLDDAEVTVAASVGIAVATGPGRDPTSLVRDADAAMYRAKERGRNRWELFDEGLRIRAVERLSLETALRRAIERDELCLHYQPIVSLADESPAGVEALVRWNHPDKGLVEPADFIRVAEETGLVVPIGNWVLTEACHALASGAIDRAFGGSQPVVVSVNVSARQLERDFIRTVHHVLNETGADPHRISIEITESVLMDDVESAVTTLQALRALGIQLWVDDFGTGYSSLAYLRRLPIHGLKIDRSFIAGLGVEAEDSAIAAGVVSLAHTLGLVALAEGVETAAQVQLLRELGCDYAQGFHWAPPLTPADLASSWPR
jgi:diguanylate cyclase (GGDEF)-like protein/PAS domain S-box-containing protein